jgi:hypothetical protein
VPDFEDLLKNIHLGSLTRNNFYWVSGDKNYQRYGIELSKTDEFFTAARKHKTTTNASSS